jgi:hypothetical protein
VGNERNDAPGEQVSTHGSGAATADRRADLDAATQRLTAARDRGLRWLLGRVDDRGRPAGADHYNGYFRLPWTLAMAGERGAAGRVLAWMEDEVLDERGDLREGPARERFTHRSASYPLTIIAHGAWDMERYDIANRVFDRLEQGGFVDPRTGGSYGERPEVRSGSRQEIFPTSQLGMTALKVGRAATARGAFEWLRRLYEAQPQLPARLYSAWGDEGLITEVPPGDDRLAFQLVTDFTKPCQAFYNPGIAAAFCARYHAATRDESALELGRAMLLLSAEGTEAQFDHSASVQICKFGWGAANLLDVDPHGDYLRHLLRMADWFADCQAPDGHWSNSPFLDPQPTEASNLDITAEFVLHCCTMLGALGGVRARS